MTDFLAELLFAGLRKVNPRGPMTSRSRFVEI